MSRRYGAIKNVLLGFSVFLASCGMFQGENITATQDDIMSLQGILPALTAAQAIGVPADANAAAAGFGAQAIMPDAQNGLPETITLMKAGAYDNETIGDDADPTLHRYPVPAADDSNYIQDLFGVGNLASVLIDTAHPDLTPGAAARVTLTILPALSASVQSVVEVYDVDDNWNFANAADTDKFESLTTTYFDGRVETRTLLSDIDDGSALYDLDLSTMPAFGDALYTYPDDPAAAEPATTATVPAGNLPFASHTTSTVDYGLGFTVSYADGREFYNQVPAGGNAVEKHTMGLLEYSWSQGANSEHGRVVSLFNEDATGASLQRARSVMVVEGSVWGIPVTYTMEELEETIISAAGGVTITTDSNFLGFGNNGGFSIAGKLDNIVRERAFDAVLRLSKTGTYTYSGSMDYTNAKGKTVTYDFTLTPDGGLVMNGRGGRGNVRFDNSNVDHKNGSSNRLVRVTNMVNGGEFNGQIRGNVLTGIYTALNGTAHDVLVTKGMAIMDDDLISGDDDDDDDD